VIVYRDANAADAAALAAFARETWIDTFGALFSAEDIAAYVTKCYGVAQQTAEITDAGLHHHLAFNGDELVGFCSTGRYELPADTGGERALELHRIYVSKALKGGGIAQALTDESIAWASAQGAGGLYLSVYHGNERAQAFYRKNGFERFGEHQFMVGGKANQMFILRRSLR
jgi:diamine N-acetyltransferase